MSNIQTINVAETANIAGNGKVRRVADAGKAKGIGRKHLPAPATVQEADVQAQTDAAQAAAGIQPVDPLPADRAPAIAPQPAREPARKRSPFAALYQGGAPRKRETQALPLHKRANADFAGTYLGRTVEVIGTSYGKERNPLADDITRNKVGKIPSNRLTFAVYLDGQYVGRERYKDDAVILAKEEAERLDAFRET